jgi:hypothetical protein
MEPEICERRPVKPNSRQNKSNSFIFSVVRTEAVPSSEATKIWNFPMPTRDQALYDSISLKFGQFMEKAAASDGNIWVGGMDKRNFR